MAVHREASWAEGTGPGATPPGPASRGWQPRRGLSRVPRGAEVDDRLFAAFLCPFSALFSRVQSPCNALASNRGKQQSRETLEPARSAALPMNAGKSHRQPWIPAPTPWFAHFGLFFPVEPAINPVQVHPPLPSCRVEAEGMENSLLHPFPG